MKMLKLMMLCILISACAEPGEGRAYDSAKEQAETIVAAIESFQVRHNAYPRALEDLVPDYLSATFLKDHAPGSSVSFHYDSNGSDEYKFEFSYSGPGRNSCFRDQTYKQKRWECKGHY
ncbi:hypothetical protein FKV24_005785 [Lysobacter maris]|uniref:Lipoprotein n=1 Tax=Marilutibacter maris TaxID=1605891 RepID=A0A508AXS0_9GAMM|nr:hypothetical protein [Lysobacter maris]KAB8194408.1 hypothetical protein FKV24_005785 [Lysobacter maris]